MTKTEIREAFARLDVRLRDRGLALSIDVAGGAVMALVYDGRESTRDVDAIRVHGCPSDVWRALVAEVGRELSLPDDWLNSRASAFAMNCSQGPVLHAGDHLKVTAASAAQMLAMKLSAMRDEVDYQDARLLLVRFSADKEGVWRLVEPFLVPGMEAWRRQNFDALWRDAHGPG